MNFPYLRSCAIPTGFHQHIDFANLGCYAKRLFTQPLSCDFLLSRVSQVVILRELPRNTRGSPGGSWEYA